MPPLLVLAGKLYTFSIGYHSKSKEYLKVERSYQTHSHNLHFKIMGLKLTIERSYQSHSQNIHFKMTALVRRFSWRRNMSSNRIHCCYTMSNSVQFSQSVLSDSVTPWIAARQASLPITNSWSLLKLMPIESVMPSSHLILCCPPLLLPSIPPSISVFSNESTLCMRWPKHLSFSFSISPSNEQPGQISFRMDWVDLLAVQGLSRVFSNTTVQKHQFFSDQLSSQSNSHIHTWPLEKP